ncbi:uncharacterized protein METZ01_LOCUS139821, partial [marine metagenome]
MAYNPTSLEFKQLSKEYNLIPIYKEIRADLDTPLSIYLKLAKNSYSFLLESITGGENLARYSIIGINPRKIIKTGKNEKLGEVDPLIEIKNEINSYKVPEIKKLPPFTGGAVGYISYDSVSYFEDSVIKNKKGDLEVPESIFMLTESLVVFDHVKQTIFIIVYTKIKDVNDSEKIYQKAVENIDKIIEQINKPVPKS